MPAPKGGEILLQITAAGVCHTDVHYRHGSFDLGRGQKLELASRGFPLPLTPGHEIAGRIAATGPDAAPLDPDRNYVVYPWMGCGSCAECLADREYFCPTARFRGVHADGGYATHVLVPDGKYLFDLGDVEPQHGAPLACSGLTAFNALMKFGDALAKEAPVVIGAGGLGQMAMGIVRALGGPQAVAVDIDMSKRESVAAAGGKVLIDGGAADAVSQVHAAVGGAPSCVVDFVGSENTAAFGFEVLRRGGKLVLVGLYGGAAPWSLPPLIMKTVTICGSYVGGKAEFAQLLELAKRGALPQVTLYPYKLEQANEALDDLEAGRINGRGILFPAGLPA
ncbi:MAG: alcohol dehydrogenase catalytic domain-containing protein [Flavobacteriaceae bacterium]